jgi:RNA polymerase sigma-70 factor (ECF subfamily)
VILRVVKTEEIAEDVLQEAMLHPALLSILRRQRPSFTWVSDQKSRNLAIDKIRSRQYRVVIARSP